MGKLEDMALLVEVAEAGGLSAAGRRLSLSPATMTARLKAIEERYQTRLFHRSTRSITLTRAAGDQHRYHTADRHSYSGGLKYTEGFTRLWPSIGTGAAFLLSIGLLSWAMRDLPVGTAYAVWVGIGAVGTAIVGMAFLGEPATAVRLGSLALVAAGIVGLKLSSSA